MFLPPWIWRIARSRRVKVALVWLPFVLMAGVAAFYGIANWKGERDVKRHLEWLREQGFATSLEELYSPVENPEENVMSHPALVAELEKSSDEMLMPFSARRFEDRFSGLARTAKRPHRSMGEGEDIRSYFRPLRHPDENAAARELFDGLEPERERLEAILPALDRPVAVWKIDYSDVNGVSYPQETDLSRLMKIVGSAERLGIFALAAGRPEQASSMADMQLKFGRHVFLAGQISVSGLIGHVALIAGENVIHEGILRRTWTDEMLAAFDRQLQKMDPQATFVRGVSAEAAYQAANYELVRQVLATMDAGFAEGWETDREVVVKRLRGLWWTVRPSGITLSELTRSNRELLKEGLVKAGERRRRFDLDDFEKFRRNEEDISPVPRSDFKELWAGVVNRAAN